MAKKGKKRGPGGGRPQATKRVTPKATPGPVKPPASGAKGGARPTGVRSAKAQPSKDRTSKDRTSKDRHTDDRASKDRPTRAERIEAARRARRRKSLAVRLAVAGIAGVLVAVLAMRVLAGRREDDAIRAQLTAGSCDYDTKADRTDASPSNHVTNPTYKVDPPAGGNHLAQASRPASYVEGQVPSDGQVVHAMEHGDVVLWHRPDLSPDDRNALQKVFDTYERDVLVVPRTTLATPVVATAWGRRLVCGSVEPAALDLFTRTYRDKGPEKLPE